MSNDCHQYKCWFPELGQRLKKAREFVGSNSSEAAQEAVSFKCWNDAEFRDHIVAVQKDGSNVVEQFDVKLRSIPSFTAHLIYPEAGETVR